MRFYRKLMLALLAGTLGGCANMEGVFDVQGDRDGVSYDRGALSYRDGANYRDGVGNRDAASYAGSYEGNQALEPSAPARELSSGERNDSGASLNRVASDLESHGEKETALALYRQAVIASADDPDVSVQYGDACMRAGKTLAAIEAYRAALAKSPDNAEAQFGLGSAMVKKGELEKGLALLTKAAPRVNSAAAYNRLGIAQMLAGQLKAAQASFASAQALTPDDLDIGTNLALVAALANEPDAAMAAVNQVAASPAAASRQRRDLVMVLSLLGRDGEARKIAPEDLSQNQLHALLARAKSIRALSDPTARAKALGIITR